jgi:hypothetical protein
MYSDRWVYDAGYTAIYKGEFTFVHFDPMPGSAHWYQIPKLDIRIFSVQQWLGMDGWNDSWYYTSVEIRLWVIAALLAIVPAFQFLRFLRRSVPTGVCAVCGYDLRATPQRCPECGTVVGGLNILTGERNSRAH